ncbi:hypothetical protein H6P81_002945 [Aristolochia fimbriata]|uniref:Aminotransferase-like plant mobile domain-containing protein n=1 Tax=Aristolochia fimbriata TaxID=158543 RepID=A0AAV7FB56_ARIFI|nr:hypothetical protein H6P81_002945 [Aristolochia fimbriata]
MLSYIEAAGFGALYRVQWLRLDKPLITALVERWKSEMNTFHLANGEMTITLEDMVLPLGLHIDGDAVTGSTQGDWMELARGLLGIELPPGSFQGGRLSLSWIRGRFLLCPDDVPDEVIQQHARAYLLHLVGLTIFSDGSARGVHMAYLILFEDFEAAGRYSWGAATLAFLYQDLAKACHTRVVGIVGCLTLMQVERPTDECHKPWWKPGVIQDIVGPPAELSGRRIWLSRTPFICFEIVELHVPDRVMLQFGLEQLGCVRNVVERVNRTEVFDTSSVNSSVLEIRHYCQLVLHSLPLLERVIVDRDVSHAGESSHVVEPTRDKAPRGCRARRRPTAETTTHVEDFDEVPAVPEPTVPDLPPEQTPEPEPDQPPEPEPSRHPPIRRIYTRT